MRVYKIVNKQLYKMVRSYFGKSDYHSEIGLLPRENFNPISFYLNSFRSKCLLIIIIIRKRIKILTVQDSLHYKNV